MEVVARLGDDDPSTAIEQSRFAGHTTDRT